MSAPADVWDKVTAALLVVAAPSPMLFHTAPLPAAALMIIGAQLIVSPAVWFSRRAPLLIGTSVMVVAIAGYVPLLAGQNLGEFAVQNTWTPLAVSSIAAHWHWSRTAYQDRRRRRLFPLLLGLLTVLAVRPWALDLATSSVGLLHTAVPALVGMYLSARRQMITHLRDQASMSEREQELRAEQARAQERSRLAAELHDSVSHRVNLMVLQAGVLRLTATDQQTVRAAETLRETGCRALDDLAEQLGMLGSPGASPADPAEAELDDGLPDLLAELVAESQTVGLPVSLHLDGQPTPIEPVAGRTAYRIVQESLTNVHKHAPGAPTTVTVTFVGDQLGLTVRNERASDPPDVSAGTGRGTGLNGLRERTQILGGRLSAGAEEGGFVVTARIPVHVH